MIIFDIETGPLPEDQIAKHLPAFDPESVKLGNLKDPDKIRDKIAAEEARRRINWFERAALSAATGQVLAIGYKTDAIYCDFVTLDFNEAAIVNQFWETCTVSDRAIGFNSHSFDLPFLVRRSWLIGVIVPSWVTAGRYWPSKFVDLLELWQCGNRQEYVSLEALAGYFGIDGKSGSGKNFADLLAVNTTAAADYLANDIRITAELAERML